MEVIRVIKPATSPRKDRGKLLKSMKEYRWQYAMFLPAAVLLFLFSYMMKVRRGIWRMPIGAFPR